MKDPPHSPSHPPQQGTREHPRAGGTSKPKRKAEPSAGVRPGQPLRASCARRAGGAGAARQMFPGGRHFKRSGSRPLPAQPLCVSKGSQVDFPCNHWVPRAFHGPLGSLARRAPRSLPGFPGHGAHLGRPARSHLERELTAPAPGKAGTPSGHSVRGLGVHRREVRPLGQEA